MQTRFAPALTSDLRALVAGQHGAPRGAEQVSRKVDSTDLLKGNKAVEISHNGSVYRLQATKLGKLILTK